MIDIIHPDAFVPTAEEIADIIWLAAYIGENLAVGKQLTHTETLPAQSDIASAVTSSSPSFDQLEATVYGSKGSTKAEVHLPKAASEHTAGNVGADSVPFQSSTTTALPGKLALARSMRPLLRRIPSCTEFILDEVATVERAAQEHAITPILKPKHARWLNLALVIDEWQTMVIWHETIREFIELLQHLGAFHTVQTWRLVTKMQMRGEDAERAVFHLYNATSSGNEGDRVCNPGELVEPNGRKLVLVLTDCSSPAWANGAAAALLSTWGAINIVTIVQMLPASMWATSALADGLQVYTTATFPSTSNRQFHVELPWHGLESKPSNSLPIPIVTLEPEVLSLWAQMLTGKDGAQTSAIYLPMQLGEYVTEQRESTGELTPEAHLQRFRATASPLARELAGYLAAAPLSLPVMRLVQHVMLPQSHQVHLAEIFRSGLIQRTSFEPTSNADTIQYDFVSGIRNLLLTTIHLSNSLKVLQKVSEYLSQHNSQLRNFYTCILDPSVVGDFVCTPNTLPIATVAVTVLRRLGGQYTKLAATIEDQIDIMDAFSGSNVAYVHNKDTESYTIEQTFQALHHVKNLLINPSIELPERPKETKHQLTWSAIDHFKAVVRCGRLYHQCRSKEKKRVVDETALLHLNNIEKEAPKLPDAERPTILALTFLWYQGLIDWQQTTRPWQKMKPDNPFIFLESLRGRKPFVGRDDLLKALKTAGTSGSLQPVLLHGLVHSGKSSLIQKATFDYYETACYTIFNIIETEKSGLSVKTVLWGMCQALNRRTHYALPDEKKFQADPFAATEEMIRNLCRQYSKFTQMLVIGNLDILYTAASGPILPGLTITRRSAIAERLINFWWRLAQTIGNLNFVFISQTAELPHNPFTPILKNLHVGLLEFKEIEKLLNAPTPEFTPLFSRRAAAQVYYLSGGQPYLAQLLAHCVIDQFNSELEKDPKPEPVFLPEDIDAVLATPPFHQFSQNYFQQLRGQLETLQPGSNAVLQAIAPNADGISSAELEQRLARKYTWAQVEKILAFLQAQQVIKHENQCWQIVGELLRRELNP